ncbi:hypothetical protein CDAR_17351 [Caerostris darwini]|uniref:Uncharacterized protein n=1 Tax=Caerostris darwini TaxID=1538125 RepID=A0AAV4M4Z0_9ARAC|nr:hypothetical protein CDAR_17351 [Caerostris darwini]
MSRKVYLLTNSKYELTEEDNETLYYKINKPDREHLWPSTVLGKLLTEFAVITFLEGKQYIHTHLSDKDPIISQCFRSKKLTFDPFQRKSAAMILNVSIPDRERVDLSSRGPPSSESKGPLVSM